MGGTASSGPEQHNYLGVGGASKTRAQMDLNISGKVLFSEGERKMERLIDS